MKQPTTVKWLKEVDFAGDELSLGDLDVALVANLAAGGRVAFRLLNQYVYRHGFDRATAPAVVRAPTLHDFGIEVIVGEVDVTPRWQFEWAGYRRLCSLR